MPGQPDQGRGGLRPPVLARRGAQRAGRHRRRRPRRTTFDNSPPDGSVGVLFGFIGGSAHARVGEAAAPTSAARRCSRASPPSSATRRARPTGYYRAGLDQGALDARLPGRPRRPGRADQVRAVAAPLGRQGPLRRHRDRRLLAGLHGRRRALRASARPGRSSRRFAADARRAPAARLVPGAPRPRHRGLARAAHARGARRARGRRSGSTGRRPRSPSGASTPCGPASPRRATRRATPASSRSCASPAAMPPPTTSSRSSTRRSSPRAT